MAFTGPLSALTKTVPAAAANSYNRIERGYVATPSEFVEALCDDGDELVSGECDGGNRFNEAQEKIATNPQQDVFMFNDFEPRARSLDYPISIESGKIGTKGWSCRAEGTYADQSVRLVAKATCAHKGT
jgi:hypothetical protein